jgi:hypothetical protein
MKRRTLALGVCVWALTGAIAFAGNPNDPTIVVTPTALSFGGLCIGVTAAPKTVTVENQAQGGGQDLIISSITRSGSGDFSHTTIGNPIPPQMSERFTVGFTPSARGSRTATFTISSNDPNDPSVDVTATGSGIDRRIASDSSTVAFGDQRVGTRSPTKSLVVRNPGLDTVTVTSVKRLGTNGADFLVTPPAVPFSIPAGNFRTLSIAFQPGGAGLRSGSLEITSNACTNPKITVGLVGTGVVPAINVAPNPIDVGAAPQGTEGPPTAVTVSNDGGVPLKITAIQIVGADAADFALSGVPVLPYTVQPSESFIFSVRMTASAEGQRLASINVLSDDPDSPTFAVPLRGVGGTPSPTPSVSASPSTTPSSTGSPSPGGATSKPRALGGPPNDSLAIGLVIAGVVLAFIGLVVARRFLRERDEDEAFG